MVTFRAIPLLHRMPSVGCRFPRQSESRDGMEHIEQLDVCPQFILSYKFNSEIFHDSPPRSCRIFKRCVKLAV